MALESILDGLKVEDNTEEDRPNLELTVEGQNYVVTLSAHKQSDNELIFTDMYMSFEINKNTKVVNKMSMSVDINRYNNVQTLNTYYEIEANTNFNFTTLSPDNINFDSIYEIIEPLTQFTASNMTNQPPARLADYCQH